jgi:hypothetical protein
MSGTRAQCKASQLHIDSQPAPGRCGMHGCSRSPRHSQCWALVWHVWQHLLQLGMAAVGHVELLQWGALQGSSKQKMVQQECSL